VRHPVVRDSGDGARRPSRGFGTIHLLDTPWVEPEDVSNAILYLVSDDGRYVAGTQFALDAGMVAK
jgi:(+)-trans-carveol dehydrogenase